MLVEDLKLLSEFNDLNETKVFDYLVDKLDEVKIQLVHCQEESMIRTLQGKALLLFEIISLIENSKDKIIELRMGKPNMSQSF